MNIKTESGLQSKMNLSWELFPDLDCNCYMTQLGGMLEQPPPVRTVDQNPSLK